MTIASTTHGAALQELPQDSNKTAWKPAERALMAQLGLIDRKRRQNVGGTWQDVPAEDAPAGVIESFLVQARRTGLDPLNRQIYCIERGGQWGVQISIDGFRLIAERSSEYRGQTVPLWCGPDGQWRDVWLSDEAPAAAKIGVYREGFAEPLWAVATWDGYVPRDRQGKANPQNQWKTNGSNQLLKCAEMLALRKAFPNDLSGLYGTEEMAASKPTAADAPAPARPVEDKPVEATLAALQQEAVAPPAFKDQAKDVQEQIDGWVKAAMACDSWADLQPIGQAAHQSGLMPVVLDASGQTLGQLLSEERTRVQEVEAAAAKAAEEGPDSAPMAMEMPSEEASDGDK